MINLSKVNYEVNSTRFENHFSSKIREVKDNNKKIEDINERLKKFESNPNFYRNNTILKVAAAIILIAAVAVASYFTFGLGIPLFLACFTAYSGSGIAALGVLMIMSSPLLGLMPLFDSRNSPFITHKSDLTNKAQLTCRNDSIKKDIQDYTKDLQLATSDTFTQESWDAMKPFITNRRFIDQDLNTEETQKLFWLSQQVACKTMLRNITNAQIN